MSREAKQTFLKGAFILVIANILVKLIGAGFKIPLTYIIHQDGMGLFNTAYTLYTFMFVVATAGFPTAVSKMVSESVARGKERETNKIFTASLFMLGIIGIVGSLVLFFGAQVFTGMIKNSRAYYGIIAISPAILCVSLVSSFRGYFQGHQNMYPTAVSEVMEALGKLVIGYVLAVMFLNKGIELASAGAVFGVTCGTFFSLLYFIIVYLSKKRKKVVKDTTSRSYRKIIKELLYIAIPITIGASVASLTNVLDMMTVVRRLQTITQVAPEFVAKYSSLIDNQVFNGAIYEKLANSLYGLYSGYAVPLFNMPLTIVTALAVSVVPAVSGARARGDEVNARVTTSSAIRLTILFAVPCAIGLSVLAEPILALLYGSGLGGSLLSKLSISIIFVSLLSVTSAILQSYSKMYIPVVNMIIGGIIKVIINYTLVAMPSVNIDGAPIGTLVCYFVISMLNMIFIMKYTKIKFGFTDFVVKPLVSGLVMGGAAYAAYKAMLNIGFDMKLSALPAIAVGGVVYVIMIFIIGAIKEEDVVMLPAGEKIVRILKKVHLMK